MRELCFSHVDVVYGSGKDAITALDNLDFTVSDGESVAIIGPSGCGKSTTLRLASGLLRPSAGTTTIDGSPIQGPRASTALILQDFGLLPWKTVRANAELGLKIRHVPRGERKERASEALQLVGLEEFADAYPGSLSGGMRQRLALARALALDVDLLLMDEPLSALDALLREQLQDTLLSLWRKEGYAQILVTHSIDEAVYLGQRIYVMAPRPGHVVTVVQNEDAGDEAYRQSGEFFARCNEVRELLRQAGGGGSHA